MKVGVVLYTLLGAAAVFSSSATQAQEPGVSAGILPMGNPVQPMANPVDSIGGSPVQPTVNPVAPIGSSPVQPFGGSAVQPMGTPPVLTIFSSAPFVAIALPMLETSTAPPINSPANHEGQSKGAPQGRGAIGKLINQDSTSPASLPEKAATPKAASPAGGRGAAGPPSGVASPGGVATRGVARTYSRVPAVGTPAEEVIREFGQPPRVSKGAKVDVLYYDNGLTVFIKNGLVAQPE